MIKEFNNSSILIIGGAGFVGSNLVKYLLNTDILKIYIVDNLISSEICNIPDDTRITFFQGSITDDKILSKIEDKIDFIFQLAAYHGNQSSIHNPLLDHENSCLSTLKLLDHIKSFHHIKKIVYSGAGCAVAKKTFRDTEAVKEKESVSLFMDSPYSISKIIGEFYSLYYFKQHSLPIVRARFQNVYGPGEILGSGQWRGTSATVWRNVIPTFIYKSLKRKALPVENNGLSTRDFIFVEDVCKGLIACALRGDLGAVYNIAHGVEYNILDLANRINSYTKNTTPVELKPRRIWDTSGHRFGSTLKSEKELGFKAEIDLDEGLKRTIEWTQSNLTIIELTMKKHINKVPELKEYF